MTILCLANRSGMQAATWTSSGRQAGVLHRMLRKRGVPGQVVGPPHGDIMRGPGAASSPCMGAAFLNSHRNKQSGAPNLKNADDTMKLLGRPPAHSCCFTT